MIYYDILAGAALALAIWLAIEHKPKLPGWRESHKRVKRKSRAEGD